MGAEEFRSANQENPVNPVEKKDDPNSITDKDEIGRIEAVGKEVEDPENMKKMKDRIENESKEELNSIKSQCINVINDFINDEDGNGQEKAVQAIVSLLRINQILGKIQLQGGKKLDLKGNYLNQLKDIIGNKGVDFTKVLDAKEGAVLNNACQKILNSLKASQEVEQRNKDNEKKSSAINTINEYIKMAGENKGVKEAFKELKKNINANEGMKQKFSEAVFALIDKCCPDLVNEKGELNDHFYSEKVEAFQKIVEDSDNEAAKEMLRNGMKKAVDGKLGRNTLNALVKFAEKGWVFNAEPVKEEEGTIKIDAGKEKVGSGDILDRMPTTLDAIMKYGELSDRKGYKIFSFHDKPGESDFVRKELKTNKEYVQIDGKKFYVKGGESGDLQFRNRPVARERYGDVQKVTELCFGKFNEEGKLTEGSKIVIDSEGKQIESIIMTDAKVTNKGKEEVVGLRTMGGKVKKGVDENGNEVTRNDVKWRIDLFEKENGKDTKAMTREQVQLLVDNPEACKAIIDQAINAYRDTLHKPSRIGRKNLNRFLHKYLENKVDEKYKKMGNKGSVEDWLGLPNGLRSDPDDKLGELAKPEYGETKDTLVADRIITKLEGLKKEINKPSEVSDGLDGLGLTAFEQQTLKKKEGYLSLGRFNTIDNNIIKHLEGFKGDIRINSKCLTPDLMNVLKNNKDIILDVDGDKLTDEQSKLFEGFQGSVNLGDIKDITPDQASCLKKINGGLTIGLRRIDENVGKNLQSVKGCLNVIKSENTPKSVAMSMIENHTGELWIGGIDKMNSDIMGKIIGHKEKITVRTNELDLGDESILNMLKGLDHEICLQSYKIDGIQNETAKDILKPLIDSGKLKIIKVNKESGGAANGTDIKF